MHMHSHIQSKGLNEDENRLSLGGCRYSYFINSFLFHLINTGAKGFQDQRTLKEEKTDGKTQPGGPSKGNEERETTGGESGHLDREAQTRGNTESGILSFFCLFVCFGHSRCLPMFYHYICASLVRLFFF